MTRRLSVADRRLVRLLSEAVELLTRSDAVLADRLGDMEDALVAWPSQVGELGASHVSVSFCETHGRERCPCGQGTPFAHISDPTGEAALRPDRAKADRAALEERLRSIGRQAEDVVRLLARYTPRQAGETERRETAASNERDERCWSCARLEVAKGVPRWEPAHRRVVLTDGAEAVWICRWCYDWIRQTGATPTTVELDRHHRGERVRRPA